ncbi:hypothetical protein [Chondromyces apiculatus]|uniref:Uncharacterized protein n=1 Tax=Chondromyces apiculatus DSM 436 TaxID=1192034 RepID=A0A017T668_9BACT|nr:hypothetical protein [Chondromyces apiculatus]EYF04046.1 Hypothetical protein CAP_4920 [Chondromyces apiculatus DSM 436]
MSDRDDPKDDLKQGLGLLWRAARKTATGLRQDLDRTQMGRALDDAGRELVRAASNVVGRLGDELKKRQVPGAEYEREEREGREEQVAFDPEHPPDGGAPLRERHRSAYARDAQDTQDTQDTQDARETQGTQDAHGKRSGRGGVRIALDDDDTRKRDEGYGGPDGGRGDGRDG